MEPTPTQGYCVNGVEFDGYDAARNVLLDAKGAGYANLLDPRNARLVECGSGP